MEPLHRSLSLPIEFEQMLSKPNSSAITLLAASPREPELDTTPNNTSRSFMSCLRPQGWLVEISGFLISLVSFAALIIILVIYDQKPVPHQVTGITLNVIVSILSTVFRLSIMVPIANCISQTTWIAFKNYMRPLDDVLYYDSASRGPLGSVKLLHRFQARQFVCLGALLTIIALGLSSFFQRTVEYFPQPAEDQTIQSKTTAAYSYNGSVDVPAGEVSNLYVVLPYNMRSAMYTGLLSSPMLPLPEPPYFCPTGNCTWAPFGSLAVGVQCVDMSSHVFLNCTENSSDKPGCRFSASDPKNDSPILNLVENANNATAMILYSDAYLNRDLNASEPGSWKPFNTSPITSALGLIHSVKTLGNLAEQNAFSWVTSDTTFEYVRCLFYVAVREIEARVQDGIYSETILREMTNAENGLRDSYVFDYDADPLSFPDAAKQLGKDDGRNYTLPGIYYRVLLSQMLNMFGQTAVPNVTLSWDHRNGGPDVLQTLYYSDNVTRSMENLAHYMTIALRSNDTLLLRATTGNDTAIAPSQAVNGKVTVQKIFVSVNWTYLSLPGVVLVLTGCFLAVTIGRSRPDSIGLWKASPLALLLHADRDISENKMVALGPLANEDAVRMAAEKMNADVVLKDGERYIARIRDAK